MRPLLGTWPAMEACALNGNQTSDPLVCRPALNPQSHTSQGLCLFYLFFTFYFELIVDLCAICKKQHTNTPRTLHPVSPTETPHVAAAQRHDQEAATDGPHSAFLSEVPFFTFLYFFLCWCLALTKLSKNLFILKKFKSHWKFIRMYNTQNPFLYIDQLLAWCPISLLSLFSSSIHATHILYSGPPTRACR